VVGEGAAPQHPCSRPASPPPDGLSRAPRNSFEIRLLNRYPPVRPPACKSACRRPERLWLTELKRIWLTGR
jgi:hypothetical protein